MSTTPTVGMSLELSVLLAPLAALATAVITARLLGVELRGLLSITTSWAQVVGLIALLSLDKGVVLTRQRHGLSPQHVADLASQLRRPVVVRLVAAGLLAGGVVGWLTGAAVPTLGAALGAMAIVALEWRAGLALAVQDWSSYKCFRVLQPTLYLLGCLLAAALVLGLGVNADGDESGQVPFDLVVGAFVASLALTALVLVIRWRGSYGAPAAPASLSSGGDATAQADWRGSAVRSGLLYHPISVAAIAAVRIDLLLGAFVLSVHDLGLYAVAVVPAATIATLGAAALVRGLTGTTDGRTPWLALAASAGASGIGILLAPLLVPRLFGTAFAGAVLPMQILLCAAPAAYAVQWAVGRLAARGRSGSAAVPQVLLCVAVAGGIFSMETAAGWATLVAAVKVGVAVLALVLERATRPSGDASAPVGRPTRPGSEQ